MRKIIAELPRAEGALAKAHSLENLATHQAEKIWLWRHRTSERASERTFVQTLAKGEGSLKFSL